MKLPVHILLAFLFIAATTQATGGTVEFPSVGNFVEKPAECILESKSQAGFDGTYVTKITVSNLWYRDKTSDTGWSVSNQMYLIAYTGQQLIIVDWVDGFEPKLKMLDLGGTGRKQIILEWDTGHAIGLRVYRFTPLYSEIAPLARVGGSSLIGSNVDDIRLVPNKNGKGYVIVTKNVLRESSNSAKVVYATYVYKDHQMVLQSQTSSEYRK